MSLAIEAIGEWVSASAVNKLLAFAGVLVEEELGNGGKTGHTGFEPRTGWQRANESSVYISEERGREKEEEEEEEGEEEEEEEEEVRV